VVAVKNYEAERVLASPPQDIFLYLFFGPDAGLVSERARNIISRAVIDPKDPFQLVRIDGDDIASDPLRLADEANTVSLFGGGGRVIWIKAQGKAFHSAVEPLLALPPPGCTIVIEAGALKKDAPLRRLCESAKGALAIPCYPDEAIDIGRLIDAEARAANLTFAQDAKAFLVTHLGQDRLATRSELEKLLLFAHGANQITLDHVAAIVCDASNIVLAETVNKAFQGELAALDSSLQHIFAGASDHHALLAAALRHALELHRARTGTDEGPRSFADASRLLGPRQREAFGQQLRQWTPGTLAEAIGTLARAIAQIRQEPSLGPPLAARALWAIAVSAQKTARQ
jgi:DNA polymerase III subunit delta